MFTPPLDAFISRATMPPTTSRHLTTRTTRDYVATSAAMLPPYVRDVIRCAAPVRARHERERHVERACYSDTMMSVKMSAARLV